LSLFSPFRFRFGSKGNGGCPGPTDPQPCGRRLIATCRGRAGRDGTACTGCTARLDLVRSPPLCFLAGLLLCPVFLLWSVGGGQRRSASHRVDLWGPAFCAWAGFVCMASSCWFVCAVRLCHEPVVCGLSVRVYLRSWSMASVRAPCNVLHFHLRYVECQIFLQMPPHFATDHMTVDSHP
jgi:hypothetical protein